MSPNSASPNACLTARRGGRGRGIRTPDTLLPKQVRYQAALYPAALDPPVRASAPRKGRRWYERGQFPSNWPRLARHPQDRKNKGCRSTLCVLHRCSELARPERFELPTTKFVAWYSIQLSYGRVEPTIVQHRGGTRPAARKGRDYSKRATRRQSLPRSCRFRSSTDTRSAIDCNVSCRSG